MPKLTFLLVDDEPEIRELSKEFISEEFPGAVLLEADDGLAGLEAQASTRVDLILSDFQMPMMNGGDMVKAIRSKSGLNKNVPVILLTGYVDAAKTSLTDFSDILFVEKPVNFESLLRCMRLSLGSVSRV